MKLKNNLKTFCFITFLFLGCCFTSIFAENWNGVEFARGQSEGKDPITGGCYPYLLVKKEVPDQMDAFEHMLLASGFRPNMVVTPNLTYIIKGSKKSANYVVFVDESDSKLSPVPSSARNFQIETWPLELIQNFPRKGPIKKVSIRSPRILCPSIVWGQEVSRDFCEAGPSTQALEEKAVSQEAPAAREEKVVARRDTRKQEIEELTEKRADLKSRLTQTRKSLITYQGEIVRCERLEREKGRLLQGTLDARESETKAKKHIVTLESAIERIEEKLAALRL